MRRGTVGDQHPGSVYKLTQSLVYVFWQHVSFNKSLEFLSKGEFLVTFSVYV